MNKNGKIDVGMIQAEVDAHGDITGKSRKKTTSVQRPGEMLKPKGDWLEDWPDMVHEFDGQGIDTNPLDRTGEVILDTHVISL